MSVAAIFALIPASNTAKPYTNMQVQPLLYPSAVLTRSCMYTDTIFTRVLNMQSAPSTAGADPGVVLRHWMLCSSNFRIRKA